MDDRFLYDARRDPNPEFADRLRARLERQGPARATLRNGPSLRWAPLAAGAAAVVATVLLFAFPSVRASAQAFIDLFRVRSFTAIPVDRTRLEQLENGTVDLKGLLGDRVQSLKEPGPPQVFADPGAAGRAAGIDVRVPAVLPLGLVQDSVSMQGSAEAQLTVDLSKLREVMSSLGIDDLRAPESLDGARVGLRVPPVVAIRYRSGTAAACLVQARSPEVSLPAGLDLGQLGEIGLRIAGLGPAEAHRVAQSLDWHSTLVVPVPTDLSSFTEVSVQGHRGLLVTTTRKTPRSDGRTPPRSILMWSDGDMVYALTGDIDRVSMTEMANSLQ